MHVKVGFIDLHLCLSIDSATYFFFANEDKKGVWKSKHSEKKII